MSVDWTKPILWDGKPARVLATDLKGEWPVAVAVMSNGGEHIWRCRVSGDGRVTNHIERWANVFQDYVGCSYITQETADRMAHDHPDDRRIARVRYTFEGDKLVDVAIVPLAEAADA